MARFRKRSFRRSRKGRRTRSIRRLRVSRGGVRI